MSWRALPRIAFAIAIFPFQPSSPADLPLEIGDELYIIEEGGAGTSWYRGYLVAPPSLLAGLTSRKGQTLEARVFSGIFPRCCVEVREVLGDTGADGESHTARAIRDSKTETVNGDSPQEYNHFRYANSLPRYASRSTSDGKLEAISNGGSPQDSAFGNSSNTSPSQQKARKQHDVGLARSLSHRSVLSPRSRQSSIEPLSITSSPREPGAKRPPAPVPMLKIGDETPTSSTEPLVDEIASCLREWHSKNLHELLLSRRYGVLDQTALLINQLHLARRQLLHGVLTDNERNSVRERTVWDLVAGNKMLCNEIIVRDPKQRGRLLTYGDSIAEISSLQSTMSLLDKPPDAQFDPLNLYHLLVELKGCVNHNLNSPTVTLALFTQQPGDSIKPLTEAFVIDLPPQDQFDKLVSSGRFRTLCTDLTSADIGENAGLNVDIYVVVRIYAKQLIEFQNPRSNGWLPRENNNQTLQRHLSTSPGPSPGKGGRQSLMWAQKQLGSSYRSRSQQDSKLTRAISNARPSTPSSSRSRPSTRDGIRPTTQQGPQSVTRTIGIGCLNVKNLLGQDAGTEQNVPIWVPSGSHSGNPPNEIDGQTSLIRDLAAGQSGGLIRSKAIDHVRLGVSSFVSPDAEGLIIQTPTLLQNVSQTPKIGFPGAPKKARSDIYITISEATVSRQARLSQPERGNASIPAALDLKNLQLTVEVRKSSGDLIQHCIFPHSNGPGKTDWKTPAVNSGEPWNQVIKLVIPKEDISDAHLIMSLIDGLESPFAISWMPLWDQGAFIQDGLHTSLLYVYEKSIASSENGRKSYLSYPWEPKTKTNPSKDEASPGPLAALKLETYLCSTVFSQDQILLGLLKWKDQSKDDLVSLLKRFVFVSEIEIVKMVDEVFGALFGIMSQCSGKDEHEDLIFDALVIVLGIGHDRRFNLGPFMDEYADSKFDYPSATPCLIRSFNRLLAQPGHPKNSRRLRATFKVGRQILKFIMNARESQKTKEAELGITANQQNFKRDLMTIFTSLESLMRDSSPVLIGSKTLVVQHMHTWLPELTKSFLDEEIFDIAMGFLAACDEVQGKLILYKLVLIANLSNLDIFRFGAIRSRLLATTPKWIQSYWGQSEQPSEQWREQIRLCCTIVSIQAEELNSDISPYFLKAIQSYRFIENTDRTAKDRLSLLFPVSYPFPSKVIASTSDFDEALIELASLLAQLGRAPFSAKFVDTGGDISTTLITILDVIRSILTGGAYPQSWISLHVYHHKSCLQILESVFGIMRDSLLPSPDDAEDFNTELWGSFFRTLLILVRSDKLTLETFPEQKRRAVWKIAGDVREQGANLLRKSWEAIGWDSSREEESRYGVSRLGGFQVQYVPRHVGPVAELCLSVHEGLRGVAVRILQTMIISEFALSEDLNAVQAEMVDCLDLMFKSKNLGEAISQKLFIHELLDLFENIARLPDDPLWQAVKNMVTVVDDLLDLLGAVHSADITEAFRIMHTLRLMNFLKDMQKQDVYIRYVHQLAEIQTSLHNYTEAGLALRLHADLYDWNSSLVPSLTDPALPEQTCFERKEQLYFEMIKHYEEGAAWGAALSSYRELARQYEHNTYDYAKLARTQRSMAKIYESITKWERHMPRYFRVIYRGLGFPTGVRDKQFIFEGGSAERISSFTDRMRQQHPSAQIVPAGEVDGMEGQYLQIFPVSPHRDLEHHLYQQSKVPHSIKEFVLSSQPSRFAVTSRRHSPASGVKDQWIEKTIYTTVESFPTISKRSEIVAINVVRLSPLQTAVERTSRKTAEIASLEKRVMDGDESVVLSISEAIKTSVDPASVASVAQYRQILPAPVDTDTNSEDEPQEEFPLTPLQNALRLALLDHASTIKHALTLLARHNLSDHPTLLDHFHTSFAPELSTLTPPPDPSPPPTAFIPQSPINTPLNHQQTSSFATITASPAPQLSLTLPNGTAPPTSPTTTSTPATPKRTSRLSLNFLKANSSNSIPSINGKRRASSSKDSDSVSASTSQTPSAATGSASASASASKPSTATHQPKKENEKSYATGSVPTLTVNGTRAGAESIDNINDYSNNNNTTAEEERPPTAQSTRSGKVKKRLSLLGIGNRAGGSLRRRAGAGDLLGGRIEE
ncbi:MAG: hypothetical protein HETSPECPRED_006464 [Heterodermia speciosa]|uniref:DOCKER domain-containing protein n=1 Tax=Heterodermia speciosa TaxID=116794 RepID=A0A8H3IPT2_9LECA|nr:MAG: hypothetical protein HETSPECPRED_006464 [Heterodermia speciosa]